MKRAVTALLPFLMASIASAEVLVLTKGAVLPRNARPLGLEGMRESLVQIEDRDEWLHTGNGDIHRQFTAWRDKADRFTIGWELENSTIVRVYYFKGAPKWRSAKMTPMKWPVSNSISIDLKSGTPIDTKAAEHVVAPNRSAAPSLKSESPHRDSEG